LRLCTIICGDDYGGLDVLINNAGIIAKGGAPALKVDLATIRATLETNALGPLHVAQALSPLLKRGKSARIVNMSSGMGELTDNSSGAPPIASRRPRSMPSPRY